jgi:hypothetical protein
MLIQASDPPTTGLLEEKNHYRKEETIANINNEFNSCFKINYSSLPNHLG